MIVSEYAWLCGHRAKIAHRHRDERDITVKSKRTPLYCALAIYACFVTASWTLAPAVHAQSVDPSKMAKVKALYAACGADVRLQERAEAEVVAAENPVKQLVTRRLEESGCPKDQVAKLADEKTASYLASVKRELPRVLQECANSYANELEEVVSKGDVELLLKFYESPTGKTYIKKQMQIMSAVGTSIGDEFAGFATKVREEIKAGKPASEFKASDRSSELAKVTPEKLVLINAILAAGSVLEKFGAGWKKVMVDAAQSQADSEEKKVIDTALDKFGAVEVIKNAMTIAYNGVYSDAELSDVKDFLSNPKSFELNQRLRQTEGEIIALQTEKLKSLSTTAMQDALGVAPPHNQSAADK